jgi:hypothetical protein
MVRYLLKQIPVHRQHLSALTDGGAEGVVRNTDSIVVLIANLIPGIVTRPSGT